MICDIGSLTEAAQKKIELEGYLKDYELTITTIHRSIDTLGTKGETLKRDKEALQFQIRNLDDLNNSLILVLQKEQVSSSKMRITLESMTKNHQQLLESIRKEDDDRLKEIEDLQILYDNLLQTLE